MGLYKEAKLCAAAQVAAEGSRHVQSRTSAVSIVVPFCGLTVSPTKYFGSYKVTPKKHTINFG